MIPAHLRAAAVHAETMARLFESARYLYTIAPWKNVLDGQVLRLDIPKLDVRGACVSVIGNLGENLGFIVFPDFNGFRACAAPASRGRGRRQLDLGTSFLSLTFEPKRVLARSMLQEIELHGWPVANSKAYPLVMHRDRTASPRPLTARDVEIAAACAAGLAIFCDRYGSCFEDGAEPVSASVIDERLDVRFTYPYDAFHQFGNVPESPDAGEPSHVPATPRAAATVAPLPAGTKPVGRNAPCPCGSGKKYKHCHLEVQERERTTRRERAAVHDLDERLMDAMHTYAYKRFGRAWTRAITVRPGAPGPDQIASARSVYHDPIEGRPVFEWFLAEFGASLSQAERDWLVAQRRIRLSIWEVLEVDAGRGLVLRDLLTGESRRVHDVQASQALAPRDAILARVVDHVEPAVICGVHPRYLSPSKAAPAVDRAQRRLRRERGGRVQALLDPKMVRFLVDSWEHAIAAADLAAAVPPRLQNTDGEDLVQTVDHFDFDPSARPAIAARLDGLEGCERAGDPQAPAGAVSSYSFTRPGNAMHPTWENTIVGMARLRRGALEVETNSTPRADALRRRVEAACGTLVRHVRREETCGAALVERVKAASGGHARPRAVPPPELIRVMQQEQRKMYSAWLDAPIPALGGQTPRQAARLVRGRRELDVLLREMENREARRPAHERADIASLRRELGLAP
jgi:hypothetical protein